LQNGFPKKNTRCTRSESPTNLFCWIFVNY
jgi:hypothetical protein